MIEFEKVMAERSKQIRGRIKWQIDFEKKLKGEEDLPFDPKQAEAKLDGVLRGDLAEKLSMVLPITNCKNIFSRGDFSTPQVTTFHGLTGRSAKDKVLAYTVQKSFKEEPPEGLRRYLTKTIKDKKERKKTFGKLIREIVAGYSSESIKQGRHAGILYQDTVIPDGVLVNGQGEPVGFCEVKAYRPHEFEALVRHLEQLTVKGKAATPNSRVVVERNGTKVELNLGVDINNEVNFIDNLRVTGYGLEKLGTEMFILLRFPNDIPDELLQSYGNILERLACTNILIQKLPLSSTELSKRAKKFVKDNLGKMRNGRARLQFSERELKTLEIYASQESSK